MLNECAGCTTPYAADLTACPHCGSTEVSRAGVAAKLVDGVPVVEPAPEKPADAGGEKAK